MGWDYYGYKPYVSVAQRRAKAAKEIAKRAKKGLKAQPVSITGRLIASTFWGKAWCTNLEGYSDYENRIPRGRSYVRNGSVVHLEIKKGRIDALVSGSELYEISIEIAALEQADWRGLKVKCAGKIGTLVELLQGKLSQAVMETVTNRSDGLFPKPKEIKMRCSCPDSARMCKHLAAVMYGVGNRLDSSPELLFVLRGVDHLELIEHAIPKAPVGANRKGRTIANQDLRAIFDIEIGDSPVVTTAAKPSGKKAPKKAAATKVAAKAAESPALKKAPEKPSAKKAVTSKAAAKVAEKPAVKKALKKATAPKAAAKIAEPIAVKKDPVVKKTSGTKKKPVKAVVKKR